MLGTAQRAAPLVAMMSLAACTYDWTVAPRSADGGGSDAHADGAAPDCAALAAAVTNARGRARTCTTSCANSVPNECGCAQSVGDADPSAVSAYQDAAHALAISGCPISCPMCIAYGANAACAVGTCFP